MGMARICTGSMDVFPVLHRAPSEAHVFNDLADWVLEKEVSPVPGDRFGGPRNVASSA